MRVNKKIVLFVIFFVFLIVLILFCHVFTKEKVLEYCYVGNEKIQEKNYLVEIIREEEDSHEYLKKLNIDYKNYTVIISHGREIEKVVFKKKNVFFNSHFIKIFLGQKQDAKTYIYITPNKDVYIDDRAPDVIIEGDNW